jgi:large subunit ribosomal protein L4
MLDLEVHNEKGEVTGSVQFDESILGDRIRPRLLHQVVVGYLANRRQGTASAKTKAQVAGSDKKPWRQKHTGRARHGDRRSPIMVGGGRAHPPKPKEWRQYTTKSMRRQALRSALLSKFLDKQVTIIESMEFDAPRTKRVASMLSALGVDKNSCLVATAKEDGMLYKSSRNIPRVRVMPARELNALDVLRSRRLVFTREVIESLAEVIK